MRDSEQKSILFVDDEQGILDGLKRMLRPQQRRWRMRFCTSGNEALRIMEEEPVEVLVTDMRMPGMDGVELLERVRERYPRVIRIVLSGYTDRDMIFRSVLYAHQYLTKPCSAGDLKNVVQRALQVQEFLGEERIRKLVAGMGSLPSLPELYRELVGSMKDPYTSLRRIAQIVEKDLGMTSQILRLVNSSFFGFFREITSAKQAVTLLGLSVLKSLVFSVEIFAPYADQEDLGIDIRRLWERSLLTGRLAGIIAGQITSEKPFIDDAVMAGTLHDLGILVLATGLPGQYQEVIRTIREEKTVLREVERTLLGVDHAQVGAYLLGIWSFRDSLVNAVYNHHHPLHARGDVFLGTVVHVADAFAGRLLEDGDPVFEDDMDIMFRQDSSWKERVESWWRICQEELAPGVFHE